jgi:hypothetical protein
MRYEIHPRLTTARNWVCVSDPAHLVAADARLIAPVDERAGFAAVPNLGVVGVVQAPAAQLPSLRASATHARLVCVEIA